MECKQKRRQSETATHITAVQRVGEEHEPAIAGGLVGLVLRDDNGAIKVLLDSDDSERRDRDSGVGIGDPKIKIKFNGVPAGQSKEGRWLRTGR
jgi:hypothetical protein